MSSGSKSQITVVGCISASGYAIPPMIVWKCHFLRYAPPVRPLLLLMDGHSSHYCPEAIRVAAKEKVILFTFPPNTTHLTQPLDCSIFDPLKMEWRKICQDFLRKSHGKVVTRFTFSALFAEAWKASMTMDPPLEFQKKAWKFLSDLLDQKQKITLRGLSWLAEEYKERCHDLQ